MPAFTAMVEPVRRLGVATSTRRAPWLLLARGVWVAIAVLAVALFVVSLPGYHDRMGTVCAQDAGCLRDQLTPARLRAHADAGISSDLYATYTLALRTVSAGVFLAVGAVIAWRRPTDWLALLVALALVTGSTAATAPALADTVPLWSIVRDLFEALPLSCLVVFLFMFPDGRFMPRWSWLLAVVFVATSVVTAFSPGSPLNLRHYPLLDNLVFFGCLGVGAASQVFRYRRISDPLARQQTKWVVYGFSAMVVASLIVDAANATAPVLAPATALLDTLVVLLIPLSLGVAILRHRLWDIDVIVNRTLLYGALTAVVVGLYVLVVGYAGAVFRTEDNLAVSLVAAGLVAVLFQPLRDRLQRGVNRLTFGDRDDPYAVLSRLGRRLEATLAPDAILATIVETVAQALRLPYAAIAFKHEEGSAIAAAYGMPVADPVRLPLVYQQETVGELLLAPRSPGEAFAAADRRLLDDLARQAGVAVHAVRLTADLRGSRERLVTAREEERRRLRRDLHDGLGPMLGSLTLKLDVASDLLERDPAAARTLLLGLKGQVQGAIGDIRRLVYALRPPALDDLGLLGALREEATRYGDTGLQVTVESPERLPPLPAAVEVAAFRIAQEALTNVARHARARTCSVRLSLEEATGTMHVEIADDGCGLALARPYGVGLASMRERAEELGGTCVVEPLPVGGTRVRASLPYAGGGEVGEVDHGAGGPSDRLSGE